MAAAAAEEKKAAKITTQPEDKTANKAAASNDSTELASSPRSDASPGSQVTSDQWPNLTGNWAGDSGEIYAVEFSGPSATSSCIKKDPEGHSVNVALRYDSGSQALWLGARWSYYAEMSSLGPRPTSVIWRGATNHKVRFSWHKVDDTCKGKEGASGKRKGGKGKGKSSWKQRS
jgi:hypothetical protein